MGDQKEVIVLLAEIKTMIWTSFFIDKQLEVA